jgi:hypothetical protein
MAGPHTLITAVYIVSLNGTAGTNPGDKSTEEDELSARPVLAGAATNAALRGKDIQTLVLASHARGPALVDLLCKKPGAVLFIGQDQKNHKDPLVDYILSLDPYRVTVVARAD